MNLRRTLSALFVFGIFADLLAAPGAQTNSHPFACTDYSQGKVFLVSAEGKVEWDYPAASCNDLWVLPNGNLLVNTGHGVLVSCGDQPGGSRVFEVDEVGNVVWQVQGDELPGVSLKFIAGLQRLPNGNTVICNWLGHGHLGQAPHLLEVTPDKRVVWSFADHVTMKTISSVQLLDVAGDVTRSEILH
jgi:hypothetical protein